MALRTDNIITTLLFEVDTASARQASSIRSSISKPITAEVDIDFDEGSFRAAEQRVVKLTEKLSRLSPDNDAFAPLVKELREAEKELDGIVKKFNQVDGASSKAGKGVGGLRGGLVRLGAAAAGIGIAEVLISGVNASVDLAAGFETTTASFEVLLGSLQEAESLIADLDQFSVVTPFTPEEIQQSAKTLLSFGRTAKEVRKDLELIGEASAATGANLQDLSIVFGQVAAAGKLQGQDALQFINQGIPLYDILAKKLNVSVGEVKKLQSEGKITFDILRDAFKDAAADGGRFAGALQKQSQTLTGLRSTLAGVRDAVLKAFGNRILDSVKAVTRSAISFGKSLLRIVEVPLSEKLRDEQRELNSLVTALTSANTSEDERSRIISEIETKYPSFLRNKKVEAATERELRDALKQANAEYEARIVLQELNQRVEAQQERVQKETERRSRSLIDFAGALASAQRVLGTELENFDDAIDQFNAQGRFEEDFVRGGREFVGNTVAITRAREALIRANNRLTVSDRRLLREQGELNEEQGKQADQLESLRKAYPELFAELEKIRNAGNADDTGGTGGTGVSQEEIESQIGSINRIKKEISDLQKLINNTSADSELQFGFAVRLQDLNRDLTAAQERISSLLITNEGFFVPIEVRPEVDFDSFVDSQDLGFDEEALQRRLRVLDVQNSLEQSKAIGNEDKLNAIRLQGLKDRRQILLESGSATAEDFIQVSADIAQLEAEIEQQRTQTALDAAEERKDIAERTARQLADVGEQLLGQRIQQIDAEITAQESRLEAVIDIAGRGNAEQLQLEEDRLRKLTLEREKAVRTQRQLAAIEIAANNAVAVSAGILAVTSAFKEGNAIKGVLTAISLAATVASTISTLSSAFSDLPSYYVGTERVEGLPTQGKIIEVHGDERVLTAKQNKPLLEWGVKNDDIPALIGLGLGKYQNAYMDSGIMQPVMLFDVSRLEKQNERLIKEQRKTQNAISSISQEMRITEDGIYLAQNSVSRIKQRRQKLRK